MRKYEVVGNVLAEEQCGIKALACKVITQAVEDATITKNCSKQERNWVRDSAWQFLKGGEALEFWCGLAGIPASVVIRGMGQQYNAFEIQEVA